MHLIKTDFLILRSLSLCDERVAFTQETHHILAPNFPFCGLSSENTASLVNTYSLKEPNF